MAGTFSCIGKQLAYHELRVVAAKLLLDFDVCFASGETGYRLLHETKDTFTCRLAPLELCFTPRKKEL